MEIIKPGIPPDIDPAFWWIGTELTCKKCGVIFRLEREDQSRVQANMTQMGKRRELALKCPTQKCGALIQYHEPSIPVQTSERPADPAPHIDSNKIEARKPDVPGGVTAAAPPLQPETQTAPGSSA